MSAEDPSFWKDVVTWVAGGAVTLIGLVWADNKRRVDNLEAKVDKINEGKVDQDEFDRQRDHIAKLFDQQADLRKDMNGGFQSIRDLIHTGQMQVMSELAKKADR